MNRRLSELTTRPAARPAGEEGIKPHVDAKDLSSEQKKDRKKM